MQPFHPFKRSSRNVSSSEDTLKAWSIELSADEGPTRHDEQLLTACPVPADPYSAWLEKREAERRTPPLRTIRPTRQFGRARVPRTRPRTVGRPPVGRPPVGRPPVIEGRARERSRERVS